MSKEYIFHSTLVPFYVISATIIKYESLGV